MDRFSLCLNGLSLIGQSILHISFAGRLTGRRPRVWQFAAYLCMLCLIELAFSQLPPGGAALPIGAGVLALYGVSRLGLKNCRPASWTAAVLAFYITQLSFGVINSAESILFSPLIGSPLLYPLLLAALAASFGISACCCAAVFRRLSLAEDSQTPYLELVLFPTLFIFAAELYILRTSYSVCVSPLPPETGRHSALLILQVMGLAALLCTLHAYRHLCRGFQAQAALQSFTQAAQAQKVYIAEAQARYERTRAFRHDIKNHLSVLDGLLRGGALDQGRAYLKKLEAASESLSFPYQTGNPVVDVLLGEKLGLAEGIHAEVSLLLPRPCGIDDFDLCVIFANALDNAISACRACQGERSIRVAGERQGDFYLLSFENTCPDTPLPPAGIGLSNIQAVAEQYRGAVLAEKTGRRFSLSVLLDIS